MRKVKAWLVTECTDWIDVLVERRDERAEGFDDPTWNHIDEIEVVLDD